MTEPLHECGSAASAPLAGAAEPRIAVFEDGALRTALVLVPLAGRSERATAEEPEPEGLFSDREWLDLIGNAGSPQSWAGKYAAKLAVAAALRLVDPRWSDVEILPAPCPHRADVHARPCRDRHEPRVVLAPGLGRGGAGIRLSITHEAEAACALVVWHDAEAAPALASAHRPEARRPAQPPAHSPATANPASTSRSRARPVPEGEVSAER